jgi:hypothetical protein
VTATLSRSSDYEARANRLRADLDSTIGKLRSNLTPSNLASEAASRAGFADVSWSGALDYAGKRHPLPTAVVGLGIALWTLASLRSRRRGATVGLTSPLTETSSTLVNSATNALRRRAEEKRQEFVGAAQAHVVSGAEKLSDEIEKRVEDIISDVPGGNRAHPLIASAIQIGIAALLEGLLHKGQR